MKIRIRRLTVDCLMEHEPVDFQPFTYLHGPIGAGKTTVAKLIDFCLGGRFAPTPVLQPIWVGASLDLSINDRDLVLVRKRDSNLLRAMWTEGKEPIDVIVPARDAGDEVVPGTGIAVLSDLLFHLAGITPPRVRRGRVSEDSDLVRLSFRDLFNYCYLDQDSMDSSFFDLSENAGHFERNKARDVLRFLVGFHQEKVSELEAELEKLRNDQAKCEAGALALEEALAGQKASSPQELAAELAKVHAEQKVVRADLTAARSQTTQLKGHAADKLQAEGRKLAMELDGLNRSLGEIAESIEADVAHRNSLRHLAVRQRRAMAARSELSGVQFERCPQCAQALPMLEAPCCSLCTQKLPNGVSSVLDDEAIEVDVKARADELDQRITLQRRAADRMRAEREDLVAEKERSDQELNEVLSNYDSAYLSSYLELEKRDSRLGQRVQSIKHLKSLAEKITSLRNQAETHGERAKAVRIELKREQELAERDRANVTLLEELFLDCVVRSGIPGITLTDIVQIRSPHFMPDVLGRDAGNLVTTNYSNMSSGGKKNLFKCCFAIALHRLARRNNSFLPTLLIIDSPMKNISERTNNPQFVGFNEMLYQLAQGELAGTQFVIIDKEYFPPAETEPDWLLVRRMTPDDPKAPPLLTRHIGGPR
jgi:hypothetical protein